MKKRIYLFLFLTIFLTGCFEQLDPEVQECITEWENYYYIYSGHYMDGRVKVVFTEEVSLKEATEILRSYGFNYEHSEEGVILSNGTIYTEEDYDEGAHAIQLYVMDGEELQWKCTLDQELQIRSVDLYDSFVLDPLSVSPSKDRPIVGIRGEGIYIFDEQSEVELAFYNDLNVDIQDAIVIIDECRSMSSDDFLSSNTSVYYPINVSLSHPLDVDKGESLYFYIYLLNNYLEYNEDYTCKLKIVQEKKPTNIYETLKVFVNVRSDYSET